MKKPYLKPQFEERMRKLMKEEYDLWLEYATKPTPNSIRVNLNKITPEKLKNNLDKKWEVIQPYKSNPEIMIIKSRLQPGELGKSIEHLLGYFYIQETSSMMPPIALSPEKGDIVLDLSASPGSKTTQLSMYMENQGTIIANDVKLDRIKILTTNLEKCGCSNIIITKNDGVRLCEKLKNKIKFDKILLDVPCSGEANTRSNPKTFIMWNEKMINKLSKLQKRLISSAVPLLKPGGVLVYSTCTHSPEECEENISFILDKFDMEIEKINIPLKYREGITEFKEKKFNPKVKLAARIYPQDNNTEGFFLARLRKL